MIISVSFLPFLFVPVNIFAYGCEYLNATHTQLIGFIGLNYATSTLVIANTRRVSSETSGT